MPQGYGKQEFGVLDRMTDSLKGAAASYIGLMDQRTQLAQEKAEKEASTSAVNAYRQALGDSTLSNEAVLGAGLAAHQQVASFSGPYANAARQSINDMTHYYALMKQPKTPTYSKEFRPMLDEKGAPLMVERNGVKFMQGWQRDVGTGGWNPSVQKVGQESAGRGGGKSPEEKLKEQMEALERKKSGILKAIYDKYGTAVDLDAIAADATKIPMEGGKMVETSELVPDPDHPGKKIPKKTGHTAQGGKSDPLIIRWLEIVKELEKGSQQLYEKGVLGQPYTPIEEIAKKKLEARGGVDKVSENRQKYPNAPTVGSTIDYEDGKRYIYLGGDPNAVESWKEAPNVKVDPELMKSEPPVEEPKKPAAPVDEGGDNA